jgi:hypothetical protein
MQVFDQEIPPAVAAEQKRIDLGPGLEFHPPPLRRRP